MSIFIGSFRIIKITKIFTPYLMSVHKVERLSHKVRVRGFRNIKNQEFTKVNDWFFRWE